MNHIKLTEVDDLLLHQTNPRLIETQIIEWIMVLRNEGVSYATIKFLVAPIFTFYQLNDVIINRKKVLRYLGEFKRVVKDQAYTTEQIQTSLQNADQRMKMILLLLASTGCRIGGLPELTLGNLARIPDYDLYRITFYEGTNNEYYTFCTRECAKTGIDNYLEYRRRSGENISFDQNTNRWQPADTPLIRQQFDINDVLQVRLQIKPMTLGGLRIAIYYHLNRCGLRQVEHVTESGGNKIRKSIPMLNGFRKHVISTFIHAGLNHEIRELIVDHNTHLDANYFRPTEDQVLVEYLKAEPYLTISPENKLRRENQRLLIKTEKIDVALAEIDQLKKQLGIE